MTEKSTPLESPAAKGCLWRNHEATPRQQQLFKAGKKRGAPTQADLLVEMLREARFQGRSVELPAIMAAGIAQHGARFNELRSHGFVIHNEIERAADGRVLSRYWLRFDPERDGAQ